jgi:adenylylsulfate kinase
VRDEIRREHEAPFVEIFVDCPLEELKKRDPKGLYAEALAGRLQNFSGVSDPYERPMTPEITVHTDRETVDQSKAAIVSWLAGRGLLNGTGNA